nr:hypothetical protein [Tanacetum cinerariifolium]
MVVAFFVKIACQTHVESTWIPLAVRQKRQLTAEQNDQNRRFVAQNSKWTRSVQDYDQNPNMVNQVSTAGAVADNASAEEADVGSQVEVAKSSETLEKPEAKSSTKTGSKNDAGVKAGRGGLMVRNQIRQVVWRFQIHLIYIFLL